MANRAPRRTLLPKGSARGKRIPSTQGGDELVADHRNPPVHRDRFIFGVPVISLFVSFFVGFEVLLWGMELPGSVVTAGALIIVPVFAATSASWAGTLLAPDRTRTRLLLVVGIALATSAIMGMIVAAGGALVRQQMLRTPVVMAILGILDVFVLLVPLLIVVLSASWATWRFRTPRDRMGRGAKLTLAVAVAVFLAGQLPLYVAGVYVNDWLNMASVALGVVLATLVFGRRGDRLGMDAAVTLCLVGVVGLIDTAVGLLYTQGYFQDLYGSPYARA